MIKYEAEHVKKFGEERGEDLVNVRGEMGVVFWVENLLADQIFSS